MYVINVIYLYLYIIHFSVSVTTTKSVFLFPRHLYLSLLTFFSVSLKFFSNSEVSPMKSPNRYIGHKFYTILLHSILALSAARAGRKIRSLRARARNRNDNAPRRGHRVNTTLPEIDFSTLQQSPRSAPSPPRFRYKHVLSVARRTAER